MDQSRARFILCFTFALALVPARVLAAEPTESTVEANALTAKAAALYDEGVVAYKTGQWAVARASFLAAWSLKQHWQIAGNLADCELTLGKYREAAAHASYYLRDAPADRKQRAQVLVDKAAAHIGTLVVRVDQPGAEVLVDGEAVGKSPLPDPVFVDPGHHTVQARLDARFATGQADVLAAGRKDVALVLQEPATTPAPVRAGPSLPVIVTGASVTGAGLVVGTILAVVAHGKASDANTQLATLGPGSTSPCAASASTCDTINGDRRARDALSDASMGTFIGAGAVALATLGYAIFTPKAKPAAGIRALPAVGAGRGGLVVSGAW
jgi:PEGA domain